MIGSPRANVNRGSQSAIENRKMAKKIKLTRPELKRHRDALDRFERYLPMLKLKQQQLQLTLREIDAKRIELLGKVEAARRSFAPYSAVLSDVAGVNIPVFAEALFPAASYSLFATPAWVDRALADLREINRLQAEAEVLQQQYDLLRKELTKIIQRVNLFEKVKIPEAREAIRVIRIHLGDEMTAAVGRAKIAKAKLAATEPAPGPERVF